MFLGVLLPLMIRKILLVSYLTLFVLFLGTKTVSGEVVSLSVLPTTTLQGDPILVQINGVEKISTIKKLTFNGQKVNIFMYQNKPSALIGIDLNQKPGIYDLKLRLSDGGIVKDSINVGKREVAEQPLGIPEKLGGDTKASQDKLVATLILEKKIVSGLFSSKKILWNDAFTLPLKDMFVTSPYGNSRKTGVYVIAHKGVDYRAVDGTEVLAANKGVIRLARSFRNYGKTIFIDHGLGLMTSYLHLSQYKVKIGDTVERGQVIGLSGHTGYAFGAHLHFGVRINKIAVDPVKFFELFN